MFDFGNCCGEEEQAADTTKAHSSQLLAHSSQLTAHTSQLAARSSKLKARCTALQLAEHLTVQTAPTARARAALLSVHQWTALLQKWAYL